MASGSRDFSLPLGIRDYAVGAEVVTAVHDVDKAFRSSWQRAGRAASSLPSLQTSMILPSLASSSSSGMPGDVVGAEDEVHFRMLALDPFSFDLLLGHAAGDADEKSGLFLFQLPGLHHLAVDLPLRVFPHLEQVLRG